MYDDHILRGGTSSAQGRGTEGNYEHKEENEEKKDQKANFQSNERYTGPRHSHDRPWMYTSPEEDKEKKDRQANFQSFMKPAENVSNGRYTGPRHYRDRTWMYTSPEKEKERSKSQFSIFHETCRECF